MSGIIASPPQGYWQDETKIVREKLSVLGLAFDASTAVPLKTEEKQEVQYKESKPPTLCLQVSLRKCYCIMKKNLRATQTLSSTPLIAEACVQGGILLRMCFK